ncbi:MAG: hypothetical protein JNL80_10905 [Phycisphaerae bacterium]|nr:hypothetical protein [Phycisphaerae bacterium]
MPSARHPIRWLSTIAVAVAFGMWTPHSPACQAPTTERPPAEPELVAPARDSYRIRFAAAAPSTPATNREAPPEAKPTPATMPDKVEAVGPKGEVPPAPAMTGRMILFFIREGRRAIHADPVDAPFYFSPQPLASVEIDALAADAVVIIDGASAAWPASVDELEGVFRVQALFRRNAASSSELRGHQAPGNLISTVKEVTLHRDTTDEIELELSEAIEAEPLGEAPNLKWIEIRSDLLSTAQGHDVLMRAGVVFPKDYEVLTAKRRFWPTIYVIPGFGGDHRMAEHYASMMMTPGAEQIAPQAVYVILDPNGPLGHHGFTDGACQGPRGEALVRELIPALEERYRLVRKPEGRVVTGHSSGGWSSLWLQLNHPDVFGACFSSAPDPVDFTAFQRSNLYADENIFLDAEGRELGSFRQPLGPEDDRVLMTVREELGVEHVLGPLGDSGEQWGAWSAMFGPARPSGRGTRLPRPAIDPVSGAIDREIIERHWSRYDIARLVTSDWPKYGPILAERVRLLCGDRDSYYLNLAVARLREKVTALKEKDIAANRMPPVGPGYIELVPRATHETIVPLTTMRWNKEMVEHLRRHGLHD